MNKPQQNRLIPIVVIMSGVILIGIAIIFGFSSRGSLLQATATPLLQTEDIPRISVEEAKSAFDSGEALFLDVRDQESYVVGHIPGAVSLPLTELPDEIDALPRERMIITY